MLRLAGVCLLSLMLAACGYHCPSSQFSLNTDSDIDAIFQEVYAKSGVTRSVLMCRHSLQELGAASAVLQRGAYFITMSLDINEYLDPDEIRAIMAHEFGHVFFDHAGVRSALSLDDRQVEADAFSSHMFGAEAMIRGLEKVVGQMEKQMGPLNDIGRAQLVKRLDAMRNLAEKTP